MVNLLKHEGYKFFKSSGFLILLIISIVWILMGSVIMAVIDNSSQGIVGIMGAEINGRGATMYSLINIDDFCLVIAIIVAMVVVNDFKSDTIKHTALYNIPRQKLFLAKFIVQMIAITLFLLIYVFIYTLVFSIYIGWGEAFTFSSLWHNSISLFLLGLLLSFAIAAFLNLFAYTAKSTVLVIVMVFLLTIITSILASLIFVAQTPFTEFLFNISLSNIILNIYKEPSAEHFIKYIILFSILFFPTIIGALLKFQKDEIK